MTIKTILYFVVIPFVIIALDSINFKNVFRKNREFHAKLLYAFVLMALSYLVVNFLVDVFNFFA